MKLKLSIVFLLLGVFTYLIFNPSVIGLSWLNLSPLIVFDGGFWYQLATCYLSDLLFYGYLLSFCSFLKDLGIPQYYLYLLYTLPIFCESFQYFKIFEGTYDHFDILLYLLCFAFYYSQIDQTNVQKNEKN